MWNFLFVKFNRDLEFFPSVIFRGETGKHKEYLVQIVLRSGKIGFD